MPLFIFLSVVLLIWLLVRSIQAKDQLAELESRLTQLHYELERLKLEKKSASEPKPPQPPPLPQPGLESFQGQPTTPVSVPFSEPAPLPPLLAPLPQPQIPPPPVAARAPARPAIRLGRFLGVKRLAWLGVRVVFL